MNAFTCIQPFASLIALGHKSIETRPQNTHHRGATLIHASKTIPPRYRDYVLYDPTAARIRELLDHHKLKLNELPLGRVIAIAHLYNSIKMDNTFIATLKICEEMNDSWEMSLGHYERGRFAWMLDKATPLSNQFEWPGQLGIWHFGDHMPQLHPEIKKWLDENPFHPSPNDECPNPKIYVPRVYMPATRQTQNPSPDSPEPRQTR